MGISVHFDHDRFRFATIVFWRLSPYIRWLAESHQSSPFQLYAGILSGGLMFAVTPPLLLETSFPIRNWNFPTRPAEPDGACKLICSLPA